ncbi:hypothetical protein [Algivirga pacifica]|uniref:Uncharacterized protein n=1 Tax=Algivirga pacifica TaxID=1162670 RepID=A0ABP9DEM8_9BACT
MMIEKKNVEQVLLSLLWGSVLLRFVLFIGSSEFLFFTDYIGIFALVMATALHLIRSPYSFPFLQIVLVTLTFGLINLWGEVDLIWVIASSNVPHVPSLLIHGIGASLWGLSGILGYKHLVESWGLTSESTKEKICNRELQPSSISS